MKNLLIGILLVAVLVGVQGQFPPPEPEERGVIPMRDVVNNYFLHDTNIRVKLDDALAIGWRQLDPVCVPNKGIRMVHDGYVDPVNNIPQQFPVELRYDVLGNLLAIRILSQAPQVWPYQPTCPSMEPPQQSYLPQIGFDEMYCGFYPGRPDPWFGEFYGVENSPHFVAEMWFRSAAYACSPSGNPDVPADAITDLAYGDMGQNNIPMTAHDLEEAGWFDTQFCVPLMGTHIVWIPKNGDITSPLGPSSLTLMRDAGGDLVGFEVTYSREGTGPFLPFLLNNPPPPSSEGFFKPPYEHEAARPDRPYEIYAWHFWWVPFDPSGGNADIADYRVPGTPRTVVTLCTAAGFFGMGNTFDYDLNIRFYDGSVNNQLNPSWGSANVPFTRFPTETGAPAFGWFPAGDFGRDYDNNTAHLPNPRQVTNDLFASRSFQISSRRLNDMHTFWGMLITMDVCSSARSTFETINIPIPACDPFKDPTCTGTASFTAGRVGSILTTDDQGNYLFDRLPFNEQTSFLDASFLYGASEGSHLALRTFVDGQLKWETFLDPIGIAPLPNNRWARSGDLRANKSPPMMLYHELFWREHNRRASEMQVQNPGWDDEKLFQEARKWVIALIQSISSREYLAALLGEPLPPYLDAENIDAPHLDICGANGCSPTDYPYDVSIDATVSMEFCAAAFRYGHVKLNNNYLRMTERFETDDKGHVLVRDTHWTRKRYDETGAEPFIRGLLSQRQPSVSPFMIDDVRNYYAGGVAEGEDLGAINIARGRELGLPPYNEMRRRLLLPPRNSWAELTDDVEMQGILANLYGSDADNGIENLDLWVGGVIEEHVDGADVGWVFYHIIRNTFLKLRHGDRFWYEHWRYWGDDSMDEQTRRDLSRNMTSEVYARELELIMEDNFEIASGELGAGVFFLKSRQLETLVAQGNLGGVLVDSTCDSEGANCRFDDGASIQLSPTFKIWWRFHDGFDVIEFQLQIVSLGWVGIGFDPFPGTMRGADIYFCRVFDNDTVEVRDSYAMDVGPPRLDIDACEDFDNNGEYDDGECFGTDDVLHEFTEGSEDRENSLTVIRFRRQMNSGDRFDKVIPTFDPSDPDQNLFIQTIFAFNPSTDEFRYHGPTRSPKTEINYFIGPYAPIDYDHKEVSEGVRILMGVLAGICILICLIFLVLLAVKTEHFRFMSPTFVGLILVAAIICYSAIFTLVEEDPGSDAGCTAFIWLAGVGFAFFFSCLWAKTFRVWRLLTTKSLKAQVISNAQLLMWVGGVTFIMIVYLAIWTGVDRPKSELQLDDDDEESYYICDTADGWWGAWIGIMLAFILCGVILTILTRNLPAEFNDAAPISWSLWNLCLIAIIAIAIGFGIPDDPTARALIMCFAIIGGITFCVLALFGPTAWRILVRRKEPRTFKSTMAMSSSRGGSSGGSSFHSSTSSDA